MSRIFPKSALEGFKDTMRLFLQEVSIISHDAGVLIFCVLVPLGYPLLYSYIYTLELTRDVPVTVIDDSHSSLSREFIRRVDASQWVHVVDRSTDVDDARLAIREQRSYGFLHIPADFTERLSRGEQAYIGLYSDMSGMLYYKGLLIAATDVSLEMNKDIKIRRAAKFTSRDNDLAAYPVENEEVALFNPQQGFAAFLIPAVLMLIVQQTLLLGIGMAGGTAAERGEYHELIAYSRRNRGTLHIILGRGLAYFLLYAVMTAYMVCVVPRLFDLVQIGHAADLLLFLLPYIIDCIFFALALSILLRNREMSIMVFVMTSVPLLFISGISWPGAAIPPFLKGVSWLFPSTFAINGFVRINTMGATLQQVSHEWMALWIQTIAYFILAYVSCRIIIRQEERRATSPTPSV